jgi:cytochrome c oxidase subunit 4
MHAREAPPGPSERTHPGTAVYVIVATFLALLTGMEISVFYVRALQPVLVPLLLLLSAAKFALVVMFYMHLRFDRRAYGAVFLCELFFAAAIIVSLLALFAAFPATS